MTKVTSFSRQLIKRLSKKAVERQPFFVKNMQIIER